MNLERRSCERSVLGALCVALAGTSGVLAGFLVLRASAPRSVVVVPSATSAAELSPGNVSDGMVRSFSLLYVALLDTYTPATVEERSAALCEYLAPAFWSRGREALERRVQLAREGRVSSHVILPSPKEVSVERTRGLRANVPALRRRYIADKPSHEARVEYRLILETIPPTTGNPFGLAIAGQTVREEPGEGADDNP